MILYSLFIFSTDLLRTRLYCPHVLCGLWPRHWVGHRGCVFIPVDKTKAFSEKPKFHSGTTYIDQIIFMCENVFKFVDSFLFYILKPKLNLFVYFYSLLKIF